MNAWATPIANCSLSAWHGHSWLCAQFEEHVLAETWNQTGRLIGFAEVWEEFRDRLFVSDIRPLL